jgi:hypothetical protein
MKSIDELIEYFDKQKNFWQKRYDELRNISESDPQVADAAARRVTYTDAVVAANDLKKNTDWVKIDYRDKSTLPKNYESVFIVTADLIIVGVGTWYDTKAQIGWYFPDGEFFDSHYVKYWLPIPELPKD